MGVIAEYYSPGEAAVKAVEAGADILLMPENFEDVYEVLLKAITDDVILEERINESFRRIYRVKFMKFMGI